VEGNLRGSFPKRGGLDLVSQKEKKEKKKDVVFGFPRGAACVLKGDRPWAQKKNKMPQKKTNTKRKESARRRSRMNPGSLRGG